MPPSKRASAAPAKASPKRQEPATPVEQPCPEHFPAGFSEGLFSVGCEHGTWLAPPAETPSGDSTPPDPSGEQQPASTDGGVEA